MKVAVCLKASARLGVALTFMLGMLFVLAPAVLWAQEQAEPEAAPVETAPEQIAPVQIDPAQTAPVQTAVNLRADPPAFTDAVEASPKRIMGVVPNFQTTNAKPADSPALTPREKFILATHQSFDISAHVGNLVQTGIEQGANSQPHYGEGWGAFGERFAASEADQVTGSYLSYGFFPTLFREDPRYFRLGHGPAEVRVWYALSRAVVTRRDSGGWTFNKSALAGTFVAGEISTTYYPQQDRNLNGVLLNCAVSFAYKGGYNVLSEFYPDLLAAIHHGKKIPLGFPRQPAS